VTSIAADDLIGTIGEAGFHMMAIPDFDYQRQAHVGRKPFCRQLLGSPDQRSEA